MARLSPQWLGKSGKQYYVKLVKSLPDLTEQQKDLCALMSDSWETYQAAAQELQQYSDEHGTLTTAGSQGNLSPHPSFRIQKQAFESYIKAQQQLRLSMGKQEAHIEDDLDEFLEGK